MPDDVVVGIARGDLNPITKLPIEDIAPDAWTQPTVRSFRCS